MNVLHHLIVDMTIGGNKLKLSTYLQCHLFSLLIVFTFNQNQGISCVYLHVWNHACLDDDHDTMSHFHQRNIEISAAKE